MATPTSFVSSRDLSSQRVGRPRGDLEPRAGRISSSSILMMSTSTILVPSRDRLVERSGEWNQARLVVPWQSRNKSFVLGRKEISVMKNAGLQ